MSTLQQAKDSHAIQAALQASLARDVAKVWPVLDPKRIEATWPRWITLMLALVRRYHGMSSLAGSVFYQDSREAVLGEQLSSDLLKLADFPDEQTLERAFGFSGPRVLTDDRYQPDSALSITQGTAKRFAAQGARLTVLDAVKADPEAIGYYRVTDGHPCAFCALLASRGAVYSKETGDFKSHNDCGCTSAPLFTRSQAVPDLNKVADRLYTDHVSHLPNGQRLAAFRKVWDQHLASQDA